jgi:hypothetical protein
MALSASAQAVLDQLALLPAPPDFSTITPAQEVDYIGASRAATVIPREGEAVARVDNLSVDASGCAVRVYVPESARPGQGLIVHFHGGGWLTGSIEMSDDSCRFLANRSGCVVVSAAPTARALRSSARVRARLSPRRRVFALRTWARDHRCSKCSSIRRSMPP